jgi:hypothetical protein
MRILLALISSRNRAVVTLAITALLVSALIVATISGRSASKASAPAQAQTQMAFFAYWSEVDGFTSTVVMNNPSSTQLMVNPMLYDLDGQALAVSPVVLPPRRQVTAKIADWLAENGAGEDFRRGNLILSYEAPDPAYLGAQVTVTNHATSLSFDFRDEMPMSFASSVLEGLWWRPDDASHFDLVLSNMEGESVNVAVRASGDQGPSGTSSFDVGLAPHQTRIVRLDDRTLPFTTRSAAGKIGGIGITHSGQPGAVLAYGLVSKPETGFSSRVTFEDPATSRSQTLAAAHLLVGEPDIPGFSGQTRFTSIALLRNASAAPLDVSPSLSLFYNGSPRTLTLTPRHLLTGKLDAIDVGGELRRAGLRGPVTGLGLTLVSTGSAGALVAHLTSYDQSRNHVFDIPLKDPSIQMNRFSNKTFPLTRVNRIDYAKSQSGSYSITITVQTQ